MLAPRVPYRDKRRASKREGAVSDKTYDLIVCGAGTAGIPATIFAARRGARVLVVEAAPEVGGTLHIAQGQISAAGTRLQAEKGIEDSPDRHYDDIVEITEGRTNKPFARLIADNAADTLHWLLDIGWRPLPEHPVLFGLRPYSVPRTYWGPEAGVSLVKALKPVFDEAVAQHDVTLLTDTEVVDLVRDDDGNVTGVVTRGKDGTTASHGGRYVLLTTGGFAGGHDFFKEATGYPLWPTGWPFCKGDGARLAIEAGAELWHRDYFIPRWSAVENPEKPGKLARISDTTSRRPAWEIFVTNEGKRFLAEDDDVPLSRERALLKVPDLTFWVVYDERIRAEAPPLFDQIDPAKVQGWFGHHPSFVRADTLEELAEQAGLPVDALLATVKAYNDGVDNGADAFGRKHLPRRIDTAPFYAVKHHGIAATTIPGISVNEKFQVIRADGSVIAGLYATGEILGMGLHSANVFVGGLGLMPALTYGKLLGERWLDFGDKKASAA